MSSSESIHLIRLGRVAYPHALRLMQLMAEARRRNGRCPETTFLGFDDFVVVADKISVTSLLASLDHGAIMAYR